MKAFATAIIAVCLSTQIGRAQTNGEIIQALGELAGELQECSEYFLLVSACVAEQDPKLSNDYRKAADKIGELAFSSGRAAGLSDKAYMSSARLKMETMKKSIGENCINSAVLLEKYVNFCQRLSRDADSRLMEWIACVHAKNRTCNAP